VTDYYAVDDEHALHLARRIVGNLNYEKQTSVSKQIACSFRDGTNWQFM